MNLDKARRTVTNFFPGAWMLATALLSIIFIIAVDWFGASLLQLLFGAGRKDELLVRPIEINATNADGTLLSLTINALCISTAIIVLFIAFWIYRSRRPMRAEKDQPEKPIMSSFQKFLLFFFLLGLAIGLGWISAGLEQLIVGDIGQLKRIDPTLQWFLTAAYLLAILFLGYIAKRGETAWEGHILPAFIVLMALSLVWVDFIADPVTRATLLFGAFALIWGYILFQQVRYHAVPVNFMQAVHKHPARQKQLVCFVSQNRKFPLSPAGGEPLTTSHFQQMIADHCSETFSPSSIDVLKESVEKWIKCDPIIAAEATIPPKLAQLLIDELIHFHRGIADQGGDAGITGAAISDHIRSEIENRAEPPSSKGGQFACDLLAIQLFASLTKHLVREGHKHVLLSDLICLYQKITGSRLNWLMPVLSVEFHSGFLGPASAGRVKLENATFIFSRDVDRNYGSVQSAQCFAWLMHALLREYYEISEGALQFTYFRAKEGDQSATLGKISSILSRGVDEVLTSGIDFENYDECSQAIREIIYRLRICDQGNIVIDFTGGQKTSTMAAVLATTSSDVKSQYISTNGYQFYGFDLRYYDMQALLS